MLTLLTDGEVVADDRSCRLIDNANIPNIFQTGFVGFRIKEFELSSSQFVTRVTIHVGPTYLFVFYVEPVNGP